MKKLFLLLPAMIYFTGCYSSTFIQPREIVKLNSTASIPIGSGSSTKYNYLTKSYDRTTTTVYAHTQRTLFKTDNTTFNLVGGFRSVTVSTKNGTKYEANYPIVARIDGERLVLSGSNLPTTKINFNDVDRVSISTIDSTKSSIAALLAIGIPLLLAFLFTSDINNLR